MRSRTRGRRRARIAGPALMAAVQASTAAAADGPPARPQRGTSPRLLRMGALGLFVLIAAAGLFLAGPQVMADEGSYLLGAALLSGQAAFNPGSGYYAGYSLLLLPAFLPHASPVAAYHLALLVNAMLVASTPFALFRLTRLVWPAAPASAHAAAALAATCHASVLLLSQLAMSENALVPAFAWLLACAATLLFRPRATVAIAVGLLAGFLFLVHPRGATMAFPVLLALTLHAIANPRYRRLLALAWAVALLVGALHGPLEHAAGRSGQGGGYSIALMLAHLRAPGGWLWLLANLAGSATEAVVASFGLVVTGAIATARMLRTRWRQGGIRRAPEVPVLVAGYLAFAVALVVTAAFFVPPFRADQLAYGRYALPTVVPLVAFGGVHLLQGTHGRIRRDFAWALAVGLGGIALAAMAYTQMAPAARSNWNFVNGTALYLVWRIAQAGSPWLVAAIAFTAATGLLVLALRRSPGSSLGIILASNLAGAAMAWAITVLPGSRYYAGKRDVVDAAAGFAATARVRPCVRLDPRLDAWHQADLAWRLYPLLAYTAPPGVPCRQALVAPVGAPVPAVMQAVAIERPSPLGQGEAIALFVEKGPALDAFATDRSIPLASLTRLAPGDRLAPVRLLAPRGPLVVQAGMPLRLQVQVTNRTHVAWPGTTPGLVPFPIVLGAHATGEAPSRWEGRSALPAALQPGETATVALDIGPFAPGTHRLHVGIVQEHVAWLDGGIDTTVDVKEPVAD